MATAPDPRKIERDRQAAEAERSGWRITIRGETAVLRRADLGPADARAVRLATGGAVTLIDVISASARLQGDLDTVTVLWWLARRHGGEPDLPYAAAEADMPSYDELLGSDTAPLSVRFGPVDDEPEDGSPEA